MNRTQPNNRFPAKKKMSGSGPTTIHLLNDSVLCIIFSFLDFFDLVRCSSVCKSWDELIKKSKLLQLLYLKQQQKQQESSYISSDVEESLNLYLEDLAMKHHRQALIEASSVYIHSWKAHSLGADQCRMKMGLLLTGVGDKVMRLWSIETYKCIAEYLIPPAGSLVDFDFDESKIVGLLRTQVCIWRRNGQKGSAFPSREGAQMKGLCMRYFDPDAVVGCEDGSVRVFDMYSRKCSKIIRMHPEPVTCLSLGDDQSILGGSSLGRITVTDYSSDQLVATLKPTYALGIKTLCYNPRSHLVFAGSDAGYVSSWDLRTMRRLWERRVSPNVIYSVQQLSNDKSTLVVGGIDGVLRVMDQNSGSVLSSYIIDEDATSSSSGYAYGAIRRRTGKRVPTDSIIDHIPKSCRPSITCLAVGMKKVVTTHNNKYVSVWKFKK